MRVTVDARQIASFFFLKKNVKERHLLINNLKKIIFKLFKNYLLIIIIKVPVNMTIFLIHIYKVKSHF